MTRLYKTVSRVIQQTEQKRNDEHVFGATPCAFPLDSVLI